MGGKGKQQRYIINSWFNFLVLKKSVLNEDSPNFLEKQCCSSINLRHPAIYTLVKEEPNLICVVGDQFHIWNALDPQIANNRLTK